MPIGLNLQVDFDTQASQPDKSTYPFNTGDGPAPPAPLGTLDAYHGIYSDYRFTNLQNFHFGLCEYYLPENLNNILEYNRECPEGFFFHSQHVACELTTDERVITNHNFHLCSYAFNVYQGSTLIFEYTNLCAELGYNFGSHMSVVLAVAGRRLGQRYNLSLCCPDEIPKIEPNGVTFDYSENCEQWHIIHDSCIEFELDVVHRDYKVNNFDLCWGRTTQTTRPVMDDLDQRLPDGTDLDRPINFDSHEWVYDYEAPCVELPTRIENYHDSHVEFEFTIDKGFQYDIILCANITNPPADYSEYDEGELHLFEFEKDYLFPCEKFEFDFYSGHNTAVDIFKELLISDVEAFSGAGTEADMQNNVRFYADGYGGASDSYDLTVPKPADVGHDHYSGGELTADLLTIQIFYDVDAYYGHNTESDLDVPKPYEFEFEFLHGSNVEDGLLTEPVFQVDTAEHGSYNEEIDLTIFPAIQIDMDFYHGATGEDFVFTLVPVFYPVNYHGSYGELELDTAESEGIGVIDNPHGAVVDATMAVTFALYADGYAGSYVEFANLSFPTTFEVDVFGGENTELDFTVVGPPLFDGDIYVGSYMEDFDVNVTKALYPRAYAGSYSDLDFTDAPAQEISIDAYGGDWCVLDDLDEENWNMYNLHGSYVDGELNIQVNMPSDGYSGQTLDDFELNYTFVSLDIDAAFGSSAEIPTNGFEVPEGPSLSFTGYHGATLDAFPTILIHETFKVHFVHDYAMYDGWGGVGGLNHCPSEHLSCSTPYDDNCVDPDNVIRFQYPLNGNLAEYESDLNIVFDDVGFLPWNPCNPSHGSGYMEVDLQAFPRLEVDFYSGNNTKIFMSRELTSFGDVPDNILYSENGEGDRHDHIDTSWLPRTFEVVFETGTTAIAWWDEEDSVTGWIGNSVEFELTQVPLYDTIAAGQALELNFLSGTKPNWFFAMGEFSVGSDVWLDFDPEIWFRFCPGYIVPVGNNVVFEFIDNEDNDCIIWAANSGERLECVLSNNVQMSADNYDGSYSWASLWVQTIWLLYARHGHNMYAYIPSTVEFYPKSFYHGSVGYVGFETLPIIGAHGIAMEIDDLVVTGPSIEWITPEGCLPNEYLPLTDSNDLDFGAGEPNDIGVVLAPNVPVENLNFLTALLATCITYKPPEIDEEQ